MGNNDAKALLTLQKAELEKLVLSQYVSIAYASSEADVAEKTQELLGKAKEDIQKKLTSSEAELKRVLCKKLNYCKLVKSDEFAFCQLAAESGVLLILEIGLPVLTIAIYLLRLGYLDGLCECSKHI